MISFIRKPGEWDDDAIVATIGEEGVELKSLRFIEGRDRPGHMQDLIFLRWDDYDRLLQSVNIYCKTREDENGKTSS
jgi:hypothetical protein